MMLIPVLVLVLVLVLLVAVAIVVVVALMVVAAGVRVTMAVVVVVGRIPVGRAVAMDAMAAKKVSFLRNIILYRQKEGFDKMDEILKD